MIASQGSLIGLICFNKPKPNLNVQLMTEVKCGTHLNSYVVLSLNKSRIRGTLRKETTDCITSKTHNDRTSRASFKSTTVSAAEFRRFFYIIDDFNQLFILFL